MAIKKGEGQDLLLQSVSCCYQKYFVKYNRGFEPETFSSKEVVAKNDNIAGIASDAKEKKKRSMIAGVDPQLQIVHTNKQTTLFFQS